MKSLDFENISNWKYIFEEIPLCETESFEVTEVKLDELENWKKNTVFTEVDNEGQEIVSVRWVLSEKTQEGVLKVKARLVAKGFEEMERNFVRKDSPTCVRENLRLVLALITLQSWKIHSMVIKISLFPRETNSKRSVFEATYRSQHK